ncbi:MAG: T9SS type A sorting domain-containing protein [Bacteroidota bacterium]
MKIKYAIIIALFISAFGIRAQIPNYVPLNGLQGYWPFTGNANDLSGNNYNGTVNGATLSNDRFNSANCAYSFNGTSNFISTNYSGILGSSPRALSFWARTSSTAGMHAVAWGGNLQGTRYSGAVSNGSCFDSSYGYVTYTTAATNNCDNNWHHYVYQFNATFINQVEVYLDAVLLTQVAASYNPTNILNTVSTFSVHFGKAAYVPAPAHFNGQIDDVGIWNRKLTLCEIQQLYTGSYPLTMNLTGNTVICNGQTSVLTANGATNCNWSNLSSGSSITVSPNVTTTYSVSGLVSGCQAQNTITVTVNASPTINLIATPGIICVGGTVSLIAAGANTYTWSSQAGNANSIMVSPTITTTYSVSASASGCQTQNTVTVIVDPGPTISLISTPGIICPGGTATLTASGANTYTWSSQPGNLPAIVISPTINTIYTLSGTNANGCTASSGITQSVAVCEGLTAINGNQQQIILYPNPANGTFSCMGIINGSRIEVYDALGNQVYQTISTEKRTEIDLTKASKGIYFVKVSFNNRTITEKIIRE